MSPTPRTDALVERLNPVGEPGNTALVPTSFARALEGEVIALRAERAALRTVLADLASTAVLREWSSGANDAYLDALKKARALIQP